MAGCTAPLPPIPPDPPRAAAAGAQAAAAAGRQQLAACLAAHGGRAAYRRIHDVNVGYDGRWQPFVNLLQPKLVDARFRGRSQERLLLSGRLPLVGQAFAGPGGRKQVAWDPAGRAPDGGVPAAADRRVRVWYEGRRAADPEVAQDAALVADAYALFLLGPYFVDQRARAVVELPGTDQVDGRPCARLRATLRPGLGLTTADGAVVLSVDRENHLLRRVQFGLDSLRSARGAEVHVDFADHASAGGVLWPRQFFERIDRPAPIPAHRWRLTGLDLNRGYARADLGGPEFTGRAAAPAGAPPPPPAAGSPPAAGRLAAPRSSFPIP